MKLIGITAKELMSRNHGLCLPEDTLQNITSNSWQLTGRLIVENTADRHRQLHLQLTTIEQDECYEDKQVNRYSECELDDEDFVHVLEEKVREVMMSEHCVIL